MSKQKTPPTSTPTPKPSTPTQKPSPISPKVTKISLVKKHLLTKKSITSWEAIELYGATRLSAHILILRKSGFLIDSKPMAQKDRYGNISNYVRYVLLKSPK